MRKRFGIGTVEYGLVERARTAISQHLDFRVQLEEQITKDYNRLCDAYGADNVAIIMKDIKTQRANNGDASLNGAAKRRRGRPRANQPELAPDTPPKKVLSYSDTRPLILEYVRKELANTTFTTADVASQLRQKGHNVSASIVAVAMSNLSEFVVIEKRKTGRRTYSIYSLKPAESAETDSGTQQDSEQSLVHA